MSRVVDHSARNGKGEISTRSRSVAWNRRLRPMNGRKLGEPWTLCPDVRILCIGAGLGWVGLGWASDETLLPALYMTYIDDIIGIWTNGSEALNHVFSFINNFNHKSLKFAIERTDSIKKSNTLP